MPSDSRVLNEDNFLDDSSRELLLENRARIRNRISQCIAENGFKRKGRSTFVLFSEDLAVFSCIEHPSAWFYTWFCVYPLYMPPLDVLMLNYGDRLSQWLHDNSMDIRDFATAAETEIWCDRTKHFIRDRFLPLTSQISTAQKITRYFGMIDQYPLFDSFKALSASRFKIEMYAWLCQHEYARSFDSAQRYLSKFESSRHTDFVNNREHALIREVFRLAKERDDRAVDDLMGGWRERNIAFLSEKKRTKKESRP